MTGRAEPEAIDWHLTTWEGARRETLRRWSELPLERIVAALEKMERVAQAFATTDKPASHAVAPDPSE